MLTAKSVKEIAEHENERRASRSASRMSVSSRRLSVAALQRLSHDSAPPELSSLSAALASRTGSFAPRDEKSRPASRCCTDCSESRPASATAACVNGDSASA